MTIEWYNNTDDAKKLNKSPTFLTSGTCNIFGSCNMDTPNFIVDSVQGNYVKFDNMYYFVDSKSYINGKWVIHCSIDDLYSNRDGINALECLIVRNEFKRNNEIADNSMMLKTNITTASYNFGEQIQYNNDKPYILGEI